MFSKACEYGIRATIFIALNSYQGLRVSLKDISAEINSPTAFTAKILQQLVKKEVIRSVQGSAGGFEIDKSKLKSIKLAHVVDAIDGDAIYTQCGLGLKKCDDEHPCPIHHKYLRVKSELTDILNNTDLEDLALGIKSGDAHLKI